MTSSVTSQLTAYGYSLVYLELVNTNKSVLISLYPVFTKFDMVDSQPVLTNLIEWIDDDVISDVTTDRFWI